MSAVLGVPSMATSSRRRTLGIVLVAATLAPAAASAARAATPKPCRAAAELVRIGRAEEAQAMYLDLLKAKPVPACAEAGLRRLARREFSTAGALIHSGFRDAAMKRIEAGRAASPSAPVPLELRRFVVAQRTFERVRNLQTSGHDRRAKRLLAAYLRTVHDRGNQTPAGGLPSDMRALIGSEGPALRWLRDLGAWLGDQGLLLLALTILAVFLVMTEVVRRLWGVARPRYSIAPFTAAEAQKDLATDFTEELREAVNNAGVALGGKRADLSKPSQPSKAQPLSSALPQLGIVDALIALVPAVIPSRDRSVDGHLQSATRKGVGASLVLAKANGRAVRQITLRQADYGPVAANGEAGAFEYSVLLPPATSWVRAAITKGSGPWRPHALFAAGAYQQEAGEFGQARRLYLEALALEPLLPDALVNLGTIEIKAGSDLHNPDLHAIARGAEYIRQAVELL
jgi:tetratricopeptide (TPR) repeat protein